MKKITAWTAFLHKNFRDMGLEEKVVFLMHVATVIFCFFPWISYVPLYGDTYFNNAFGGPTKVIGIMIFLISLAIGVFFVSKLFRSKVLNLPLKEELVFIIAGFQQIVLIICAWSVLIFMGAEYDVSEIRFGFIFCLLFQVFGIVAAFLMYHGQKKEAVVSFFHQGEGAVEDKVKNLFNQKDMKK